MTFRQLGPSTWRCEEFGVDAMWSARGRLFGVQRKELKDLVASVQDGRLAKEMMQVGRLDVAVLVIETGERNGGWPRVSGGMLADLGGFTRPWTISQLRGLVWSVMARGVWVLTVKDERECVEMLGDLEKWSKKDRHESLMGRGQVPGGLFGSRGSREFGVWMLSSLPGVGVKMAGDIWDEFGGDVVRLSDKVVERGGGDAVKGLTTVKGVGKVTATKIAEVFE